MRHPHTLLRNALILLGASTAAACGGGGGGSGPGGTSQVGRFEVLNANMDEGVVWELNRPMRIEFNHSIDPSSISFGSVLIRPLDQAVLGHPVTGVFEFEAGSNQKVLIFRPTCPTNEQDDNGGLVPGGYRYELALPTQQSSGVTVLRDQDGRPLALGLARHFWTPNPPGQALFLDPRPTPPQIVSVEWPTGLNLFTAPDPIIHVFIDQPIDGGSDNLNTNNLYVLYADGEIGQAGENSFPAANLLPGSWVLTANCTSTGAEIAFQISGLLPVHRRLRLIMENTFRDLSGQTNVARSTWSPDHITPSLTELYDDPTWSESQETVDEIRETFDSGNDLAGDDELSLPPATVEDGRLTAGFDFPGRFVSEDADLVVDGDLEIFTDGTTTFTDSNGKNFTVQSGVLYVDDFTINSGRRLRGRGKNPLVIYATGNVTLNGTLDVSGNNSHWPSSLNAPQFPEGGALGECGGGQGGDSSWVAVAETTRGEAGDGPFGLLHSGGGGGEGGFNQTENIDQKQGPLGPLMDPVFNDARIIAGGGAGGTYGNQINPSLTWGDDPNVLNARWIGVQDPADFDDDGPDHIEAEHPSFDETAVRGGENGMRGSSFESKGPVLSGWPEGTYGMEDELVDKVAYDGSTTDPPGGDSNAWRIAWVDPTSMSATQINGDPTAGPDAGITNRSIFSFDPNNPVASSANDFWGRRQNTDGTVTVGELLAPWAGSGGGAGGDTEIVKRLDPISGTLRPITDVFPDRPFRTNSTWYYKSAPGGGGGGQLLILAIGTVKLGANSLILANGGIGHGGESIIYTYNQVSGSGGGSGGHVAIHSATKIDLSAIDIGTANTAAQVPSLKRVEALQAIGGRRGWCMSFIDWLYNTTIRDGNGDYMIGRGGAGGPGVISLHVPDPLQNIVWNSRSSAGIQAYIKTADGTLDTDKLETVLDLYGAPRPFMLIPFFSATSQAQSVWTDTGLAYLRRDAANAGTYPDWNNAMLHFAGIESDGDVPRTGSRVTQLTDFVATGTPGAVTFAPFELTIPSASARFTSASFLRSPNTLVGYDVLPNTSNPNASYEVVSASYDRGSDTMLLTTRNTDGPMSLSSGTWAVRPKFFRIDTSGVKDALPASTNVNIVFQGTDDPANSASIVPGVNEWTADLSVVRGKRFVRWRAIFDIDRQDAGVDLNSARPSLDYLKVPFVW